MALFWTETYRKHFQKQFRKPFDIQVYHDRHGSALKLATHDLALPGFRVYASLGMSDRLVQNEEEEFGEVILFADEPDKEIPQLFVQALFFILHNDIALGSRFAVGGIDAMRPEFALRYHKSALYFTRMTTEAKTSHLITSKDAIAVEATNKVRDGDEFGQIYQAFFITPEEEDYLDEMGADSFEAKFQEQAGELLALRRLPCV